MIKKIYDRDTGNIYDVGADSKLKLVAEGTPFASGYNEHYDSYLLPKSLEHNKIYLFVIECSETIHILYPTIMGVGIVYGRYYNNSEGDCYDNGGYIYYENEDKDNPNIVHKYVLISTADNEYRADVTGTTLKVYELPFIL